jgi:hypothetical protein
VEEPETRFKAIVSVSSWNLVMMKGSVACVLSVAKQAVLWPKKKTADVSRKQNRDGGNTFTDCEPEFTFHVPCKAVDALGLTE